ncbi:sensor histidine kinase [Parvicella tangerina]|uniref:Histidine kinase domain-containing protein n=1 Tax=Parvicella tangerina TaxID=2829795 RepID=A0A916JQE1_9FLAO|nr:sensor histidine kinase [Parvicella tangerina]CAG5086085.1 hypothetical protein CRYO30217_03002 [Parvicella tangerina]
MSSSQSWNQRLINSGTLGLTNPEEIKRVRLSNLIALTVFTTGTPFAAIFFYFATKLSGVVLIFYILSFWSVIELNKRYRFKLARFVMVLLLNAAVIHYSIWYGKGAGLHMMLIPFFCVPFLIYSKRDGWWMFVGSLISSAGFLMIDFIPFQPIIQLSIRSESFIYHGITAMAWLWLIFEMVYLTDQNYIAVKNLISQRKGQTEAIIRSQELERNRIARDLHDSIGQLLSAAKVNLEQLSGRHDETIQNSINLIDQSVEEMRNVAFHLMPNTLESYGLLPALEELVDRINGFSSFDLAFHTHGFVSNQIGKDLQYNIYRIVQEALNNVLKHAEANEVCLQLIEVEQRLMIIIEDDGKGFAYNLLKREGRGLQNIAARVEWMDGKFTVDSGKTIGTTLIIEVPFRKLNEMQ